jgi:DNA-binding NarL/FixJ family response regulator
VVDISMPVLNGIDAVRQIRKSGGKGRVIFLTVHEDPIWCLRVLTPGRWVS